MLLVGVTVGPLAHKNVCFKTPWEAGMAVNVSLRGTAWSTMLLWWV